MEFLSSPNNNNKVSKPSKLRALVRQRRRSGAPQRPPNDQGYTPYNAGARGDGFSKFFTASPFPVRKRSQLAYTQQYTLASGTAGVFTAKSFRCNSLYDPDFSGVGVYPTGYASLAAIYKAYRVSAVTVDFLFTDPSADGACVCAMFTATGDGTALAGMSTITADGRQNADMRMLNNTGTQTVRITRRFTSWDLEGVPFLQWVANPNYAAQFGSNPAWGGLFQVGVGSMAGSSGTTVVCQVRMTFECETYDRLVL